MKKKITFIILTLILIIIGVVILIQLNNRKVTIYMHSWHDNDLKKEVIEIKCDDVETSYIGDCMSLTCVKSVDDSFEKEIINNEYYVSRHKTSVDDMKANGYLLFIDNDYYYIYNILYSIGYDENGAEVYSEISFKNCNIRNLVSSFSVNNTTIYIPLQCILHYSDRNDIDIQNYFNEYSFDESIVFYERFTDYISIDYNNQLIKIETQTRYNNYVVTINYKNKSFEIQYDNEIVIIN